jgi:hypothetical protein
MVDKVTPQNPFSRMFFTYNSTKDNVDITPIAVPNKNAKSFASGRFHTAKIPPTEVLNPASVERRRA